jgi:O-antigen/teichoic acid export membrane protein
MFLIAGHVVGLALWFVLFATAKRTLGTDFGAYSLVLVTVGPLYHLSLDFGMRHLTVREVARDSSLASQYLLAGGLVKLGIAVPSFMVLLVLFHGLYTPAVRIALTIGCLAFVIKSFTLFLTALFDAQERMHLTALITTAEAALIFAVCMPVLYLFRGDNRPVLLAEACASAAVMLAAVMLVSSVLRRSRPRLHASHLWAFFKTAAPFGMYFVFGAIYGQAGALLLSKMRGPEVWGQYLAPMALVLKIELLPKFFAGALYPTISKEYHESPASARTMYEHAARIVILFALPAAVGTCILAPQIIEFAFGGGTEEIVLLRILAWLIPLRFLGYVLNTTIFAVNKQRIGMYILGGATIASIVLNALLIAGSGARGAAIATLIVTSGVVIALLWQVRLSLSCSAAPPGSLACILSCAIMAGFLFVARQLHPVAAMAAAGLVYVISIFALGGVKQSDVRIVLGLLSERETSTDRVDKGR